MVGFLRTSWDNIGLDNFSSNSWTFYFFIFVIGSLEQIYSVCLFYDVALFNYARVPIEDY